MPNNPDDLSRTEADAILDGVGAGSTVEWNDTPATPEQILADIQTAIAGVPPAADRAAVSLTELSRSMVWPTIPSMRAFADGGVIRNSEFRDRYIGESADYEMETFIPLRRAENLLRGSYSMSHAVDDHGPQQNHPDQDDDINREVVARWRSGAANQAEIERARQHSLACPCSTCITDIYEGIVAALPPARPGYSDSCTCPSCRAWRRDVALAIQAYILEGRLAPPVRSFNIQMDVRQAAESMLSGPDMADALAMSMPVGTVTGTKRPDGQIEVMIHGDLRPRRAAVRAAQAAMTPFERNRERRGHPVPQTQVASGWQPNQWEA